MQIKSIGIDLGKTTFHLVALNSRSRVVVRKKFSRQQLLSWQALQLLQPHGRITMRWPDRSSS
jgi:hypothetical protein